MKETTPSKRMYKASCRAYGRENGHELNVGKVARGYSPTTPSQYFEVRVASTVIARLERLARFLADEDTDAPRRDPVD